MRSLWHPNIQDNPYICSFIDAVNKRYALDLPRDDYKALHDWSVKQSDQFWSAIWDECGVIGDKGEAIITPSDKPPYARFFEDSRINYGENMLAYWQKNPDKPAIIYQHQNQPERILSGQDLCENVSLWEQALRRQGIKTGDCIGLYLPNIPETDIILIAAANIGAILCSAGMEMGTDDLIARFKTAQPKLLITADSYHYGDKTIDRTETIKAAQSQIGSLKDTAFIDLQTGQCALLNDLTPQPLTFERHDFNHPLYILFSSGSTGAPKAFVHGAGGVLLKHISEYRLHADINEGSRAFYHATPSWMMWNWAASCLAVGATQLKHSGNPFTPDAAQQLRFTAKHHCTHHGTAAPVIMGWKDQGLNANDHHDIDLSDLRCILYTGAVLPDIGFTYIQDNIKKGVQISGISGGTDIVGCFLSGNPLTPVYAGQIAAPCLGVDIEIWDDDARIIHDTEAGELVCIQAFPSMPIAFKNDERGERYYDAYYNHYADQKVWRHGDTIQRTNEGQIIIIGRSDGTLNQNGVRIGSIALYNQLEPFKSDVKAACAIDFIRPDTKQSATILCLALQDEGAQEIPQDLEKAIKTAIKNNVGPYSIPAHIIKVPDVLRTKNGKLAEVVTKKILNGATIDNASLYGRDLVAFYEGLAQQLRDQYSA